MRAAAVLGVLLLAACARPPLETEADQAARTFFAAVAGGDWPAVEAALAPGSAGARGRLQGFEQARRAIPGGRLEASRAVGWRRTQVGSHKRMSVVHLYRYPGADVVVETALQRAPPSNSYKVVGFFLNRVPPGVVEANRFTLAGKSLRHYLFLLSAAVSPAVMLGVAVIAAMTPGLRFKWLWIPLCFVGVGSAFMNWTTGQGGFQPAELGLVNLGAGRATDISPWILKFSAPIGAIVVLVVLLFHRPKAASS